MKTIVNLVDGTACSYFLAYKCLMEKNQELCKFYHDRSSVYIFPAITVASLSCEIALKNHIKNERGEIRKGHNLKELFDRLSQERRSNFTNRTVNLFNYKASTLGSAEYLTSEKFETVLAENKNTFTDSRYLYEGILPVDIDFLEALIFCLNDVDEEYSDFIRLYTTMT